MFPKPIFSTRRGPEKGAFGGFVFTFLYMLENKPALLSVLRRRYDKEQSGGRPPPILFSGGIFHD